ncbi:MAG: hypothetical protein AB1610_06510 [Nitrospirota bacterium]
MKPVIIGIGGSYSEVGKTTFACSLLKRLKGWGAIKYTKTPLYCSITEDIDILSKEGKDTKRFLESGAEKVIWVQSPFKNLKETLQLAVENLSYLKGIIIEGNSPVEVLEPDIVIFISGDEGEKIKKNSMRTLKKADIIIYDKELPPCIPEGIKIFNNKNKREDCLDAVNFILKKLAKR